MFKKFNWDGNLEQVFSSDYTTQIITNKTISQLNRNQPFTMESPHNKLVIFPQSSTSASDNYSLDLSTFSIKEGGVVIDGANTIFTNGMSIGDSDNQASLEIYNVGGLLGDPPENPENPYPANYIKKNGSFTGIFNSYINLSGSYIIEGNGRLILSASNNIKVRNSNYSLVASDNAIAELKTSLFLGEGVEYSASGSANIIISANTVKGQDSGNLHNFHLGNGTPKITVTRNTTIPTLQNVRFNFDTLNGINNGCYILDFAIDPGDTVNGANRIGVNYLLKNGMITIDNNVQSDDKRLNFDWGQSLGLNYGFLVISLK